MGLFDLFGAAKGNDINTLVDEARQTKGAAIIDVRTPEEFSAGHIEGAHNIPLDQIDVALKVIKDPNAPLYLYCRSGARSGSATKFLQSKGYANVTNMGGIMSWTGPVVEGIE